MSIKRRLYTAVESERLLEDFYENLDTESFLRNDFVGEDDPVKERSDDENSKDESVERSEEETEECAPMKLLNSHSFRESKYSKISMKFWMKAIMKNFQHKKNCLQSWNQRSEIPNQVYYP